MELNRFIDHTLLKADAKKEDIKNLCEEAQDYNFKSVCINPTWVKYASELLNNSTVEVCTVIGFPLGANSSKIKKIETEKAIEDGATEVDMVINIGALKSGDLKTVEEDIRLVIEAVNSKAIVKIIIETSLLSDEEKVTVSKIIEKVGADFVKTSTGFSTGGATLSDVSLIRDNISDSMGIKASGGIRDKETAVEMINAGATRIGASSGIEIVSQ